MNAALEAAPPVEVDGELVDVSQWPGTAEASKIAGRHPSTIKLWRTQRRIRAVQDTAGCWRHHPDDLVEQSDMPDGTDPGSVLASGMSAIVTQGERAGDRVLEMSVITTDGLKDTCDLLREELKRAYAKISELETRLDDARDKLSATHAEDRKHDRHVLRMQQKHEMELASSKETSERIAGMLTIIGPIAASVGARWLGDTARAEKIESAISGAPAPPVSSPASADGNRLVPLETRITDAMARLCAAIRSLDGTAFAGLKAMLPEPVARAFDDVAHKTEDHTAVGNALAVIIQAAQKLSDLQFMALRPIAPQDVAAVLGELRQLFKDNDVAPPS